MAELPFCQLMLLWGLVARSVWSQTAASLKSQSPRRSLQLEREPSRGAAHVPSLPGPEAPLHWAAAAAAAAEAGSAPARYGRIMWRWRL